MNLYACKETIIKIKVKDDEESFIVFDDELFLFLFISLYA